LTGNLIKGILMAICILSMDLMFPSRARVAAAAQGVELAVAMSPAALDDRLAEGACPLLIIDLAACHVDLSEFIPQLRSAENSPAAILAVGPHVQEDMLRAANDAGCDAVLTNGQFHAQVDELIAQYSSV
jgi:DNA-binding NarL/FixJ family response regulator